MGNNKDKENEKNDKEPAMKSVSVRGNLVTEVSCIDNKDKTALEKFKDEQEAALRQKLSASFKEDDSDFKNIDAKIKTVNIEDPTCVEVEEKKAAQRRRRRSTKEVAAFDFDVEVEFDSN